MPNTESNTSRYKTGRIPIIALDYSSRQLAEKRELLVDYKNAKLYVVSAEDKTVIYDITEKIIETFRESGDISNFTVNIEGVGIYDLGTIITQLFNSKIDLIEDKEFVYYTPTTSFDNMSLAVYDRQASLVNFPTAPDRTVPMKESGVLVWKDFDIETLSAKVKHLEEIAPPDDNEFTQFRKRLEAVEATDALYKDLPNMKNDISTNGIKIKNLEAQLTKLDQLATIQSNIASLTNTVNTNVAKLKSDEAKIDTLTTKVNEDNSTLVFLQERANTNAATLSDLISRTTKLENINAKDRLTTAENTISNIQDQLRSIATTEAVAHIDERLHTLEDRYPVDIQTIQNNIAAITTKTNGYDKDLPTLKTKVANLEQSMASLAGIDMDQINNTIDQKVDAVKQTIDSYTQTNASMQTLVDQLKKTVDGYSATIDNIQNNITDINGKYMPIKGGTFTGEVTGPAFHGVADSAITIKDINNKEAVYGNSRIVITDNNGDMNTIDGIKYTNDSITLPLKLTVNEISSKTISDLKTDMATKIGVPLSLANADKAFTNVYGASDRNTNYVFPNGRPTVGAYSILSTEAFLGKAILYIDTADNKLKVFSLSEEETPGGSSTSGSGTSGGSSSGGGTSQP